MFAKPNLTLAERSALMLTIVQASLMAYFKHQRWLDEDHRATVIDSWLKRNDRKAGISFRMKISAAADEMVRFMVATQERDVLLELYTFLEHAQDSIPGSSHEIDSVLHGLMEECERVLIAKGLAS